MKSNSRKSKLTDKVKQGLGGGTPRFATVFPGSGGLPGLEGVVPGSGAVIPGFGVISNLHLQ